jgi:hypothetical protein
MEKINVDLLAEMGMYVQKSKTFLWPLLNLKIQPIETYLKIGDLDLEDNRVLIALFHNENAQYISMKKEIESHPMCDFIFKDSEFDIVFFNMYKIKDDYDMLVQGSYSKLSNNFKIVMSGVEKRKPVLMCLYPENNYKEFAEVLNIHEHELEGKELLSPPNNEHETMYVIPTIKEQIIEEYGLN